MSEARDPEEAAFAATSPKRGEALKPALRRPSLSFLHHLACSTNTLQSLFAPCSSLSLSLDRLSPFFLSPSPLHLSNGSSQARKVYVPARRYCYSLSLTSSNPIDGKDKVRVFRMVRNADGTHDVAEWIVCALVEG